MQRSGFDYRHYDCLTGLRGGFMVIYIYIYINTHTHTRTVSMIQWLEFLDTGPEVPASIPGATRFSEK
jgi:hypothetical protein